MDEKKNNIKRSKLKFLGGFIIENIVYLYIEFFECIHTYTEQSIRVRIRDIIFVELKLKNSVALDEC